MELGYNGTLDEILRRLRDKYKGRRLGELNDFYLKSDAEFRDIIVNHDELRTMLNQLLQDRFIIKNNAHDWHHIEISRAGIEFINGGGYTKREANEKTLQKNARRAVRQNYIILALTIFTSAIALLAFLVQIFGNPFSDNNN